MGCREWMTLNKRLLPVKATYFFTLGGVASLLPFLAVYMKQIGLSPAETAIIYGTMPFIGAFVRFIVGALADKLRKHKQALILVCFLSGILHACLLFVPAVQNGSCDLEVTVKCGADLSSLSYCPMPDSTPASEVATSIKPLDTRVNLLNSTPVPSEPYSAQNTDNTFSGCTLQCEGTESTICFNGESDPVCVNNNCKGNMSLSCLTTESDSTSYQQSGECYDLNLNSFSVDTVSNRTFSKMHCLTPADLTCKLKCTGDDFKQKGWADCSTEGMYGRSFWIFFVICLLAQVAFAPVFSLIDAMTYSHLGEERGKWGWNRLWGTVGFAIFAVVSAISMEVFQKNEQEKNYTYSFILFAVLNIISSIIVYFYKFESDVVASQVMKNVMGLLKRVDIVALLVSVFAFGAYTGVIETFLYWHLETLGASKLLMGLAMAVNCLPEIFILLVAGWLIKRIGHVSNIVIVFAGYAIRLLGYSFLTNPWIVLVIEPLHAVTFGLMYATVTSYGSIITPPGMHGTVQGVIGALYFGAGKGVGSVLGGLIFQKYGAAVTFQSYAVSSAILMVFYVLVHCLVVRPRLKKEKQKKKGESPLKEKDVNGDVEAETKMLNGNLDTMNDNVEKPATKEAEALMDGERDQSEKC